MGQKRRRDHSSSHSHKMANRDHKSWSHSKGKRRRLSNDQDPAAQRNAEDSIPKNGQRDSNWTVVTSKHAKKHDGRSQNGESVLSSRPSLRKHKAYQSDITLRDLRDLALYVLTDEIAPKWVAVDNAKKVSKVAVIMTPGLDLKLLEAAKSKISQRATTSSTEPKDNEVSSETPQPEESGIPPILRDVLSVRGPGDTKMNKVHSPLQAILLAQTAVSKSQNGGASGERAPITEFVHSADELRDAEYPIHPAAFTIQKDAEYELERRSRTGQTEKEGWVLTNVSTSRPEIPKDSADWLSRGLIIYSLDCEMVQTSDDKYSLARISLISYPNGETIIDKFVKPDLPIVNYHTQYSGITPDILENVTTTLADIQTELLNLLTPSTILLGHSLDSDLTALKLLHPFVVDTSIIFPHPRGLPLRSSLKYLANKYLKREIQNAGANGHNSVEDAKAVLDLVKLKCEKGAKYGTVEANGEPIFRLLKRNGRTSAMVEYGTPERGLGKDADYTIGAQDDNGVLAGVIRAVKGDDFFDFEIPPKGVDFIWGRFRALEFARGWSNTSLAHASSASDKNTKPDVADGEGTDADGELVSLAIDTIERLEKIYEALPVDSLLIVLSGTGDMRPVMQLQAQQQQYRKEFKVKKWDELSVKWTDTEEQALRAACEGARAGWAICNIK